MNVPSAPGVPMPVLEVGGVDPGGARHPRLVSVVVPAYRAADRIDRALASVFAQTYHDVEVIVVNDGSPETAELEAAIAADRDRIRYFRSPHTGPGGARNVGILQSHGAYIAFLDADDRWLPAFASEQVAFLEGTPSCDAVYCDALITGDSPLAGRTFMDTAPSVRPVTLEALLLQRANVLTSGLVARAPALFAAGLFDPSLQRGQDFDLWIRMAHAGCRFDFQRRVLVERTERSTGSPDDAIADVRRVLNVLEKIELTLTLSGDARAALVRRIAWARDHLEIEQSKRALQARDFAAARNHLGRVRRKNPKSLAALAMLAIAPDAVAVLYPHWTRLVAGIKRRFGRSSLQQSSSF